MTTATTEHSHVPQVSYDVTRSPHVILQLIVRNHRIKECLGPTGNLIRYLNLDDIEIVTQLNICTQQQYKNIETVSGPCNTCF